VTEHVWTVVISGVVALVAVGGIVIQTVRIPSERRRAALDERKSIEDSANVQVTRMSTLINEIERTTSVRIRELERKVTELEDDNRRLRLDLLDLLHEQRKTRREGSEG
jgi:hypothetical protein